MLAVQGKEEVKTTQYETVVNMYTKYYFNGATICMSHCLQQRCPTQMILQATLEMPNNSPGGI